MTDIVGGKKISECTAATEINNADLFPLVQAGTNKYSLWSTIKSVLKTYFDALYQGVMGADDNYVTNAEKVIIGNTSNTNSGDETATSIGTLINGAYGKTTPVDADYVGLMDSNALNILKKLSWANIKATLKTYFDALYQGVMGADDNYVTNAEKVIIGNTSNTNSGDETTTSVGTLINGATDKSTPVDADYVGLMDSNDLNILKKLSWSNIKATLKTYFDGLYTPLGKVVGINDQTGTTYTLVLADAGKYIRCTNADSIAVTVPTNAAVAYDTGTVITIEQGGAGVITVAGDIDVTVNGYGSGLSTAGQYAVLQLIKTGSDEWTCIGGTTA